MAYHEEFENITVLGNTGVGKSALTIRLATGNFVAEYDPTIEDSYRKQAEIPSTDGTLRVILDVLDTAGMEEFGFIGSRGAIMTGNGYLIVYDISSRVSFEKVGYIREQILHTENNYGPSVYGYDEVDYDGVPIVVVGNKCDLPNDQRQVTTEEGVKFAQECKIPFFETSAKEGINNIECFYQIVRDHHRIRCRRSDEQEKKEKETKKKKRKKRYCVLL